MKLKPKHNNEPLMTLHNTNKYNANINTDVLFKQINDLKDDKDLLQKNVKSLKKYLKIYFIVTILELVIILCQLI